MHGSTIFRSAAATLAVVLFAASGALQASGGDGYMENNFMPEYRVAEPELLGYAGGKLGVVSPSYWRVYQFIAYRALTGHPLSRTDMALLNVSGWKVGGDAEGAAADNDDGVAKWLGARKTVTGAAAVNTVNVETDVGDYTSIVNCPADTFDRASKTLALRLQQGGQQWAAVWLAGQDAVFANCSPQLDQQQRTSAALLRPLTLPAALPAKAPVWLVKDDAYQRAAAHFYAGRYDEARAQFLAIAKDGASPWQPLGKYLAARALVRSVMTAKRADGEKEQKILNDKLLTARNEMAAIVPEYAPAKGMLGWIDIRARPEERRRELAAALSVDPVTTATPQLLTDYLFMMDKLSPEQMAGAADPMTAWIGAMQASSLDPYDRSESDDTKKRRAMGIEVARAHWNKQHEALWLLPLLTHARAGDLTAAESKAAAAVKADSPAYVSLQYHLARIALVEGRVKDADGIVTALLAKPHAASARNYFKRIKMVSASTAEAAFAVATRTSAFDERGVPITDEDKKQAAASFGEDVTTHLQQHFSLATLMRLRPLYAPLQSQSVADMTWTRAVLLGQYGIADELTDVLARDRATTRHLYQRFKKAATPDAKRDAAMLILANSPELNPDAGSSDGASSDGIAEIAPAFLNTQEVTQVNKELEQLKKLPHRNIYLIPRVIEWARKNKADPEGPKALHFLVAATRLSSGGATGEAGSRNYSKEAFDVLHKEFPKSEWTVKTRYYY